MGLKHKKVFSLMQKILVPKKIYRDIPENIILKDCDKLE
jgi:hypothetical protein